MKRWIAVLCTAVCLMSIGTVGVLAEAAPVTLNAAVDGGVAVSSVQVTMSAQQRDELLEKQTDVLSARAAVPPTAVTDGQVRVAVARGETEAFAKYKKEENRPFAAFELSLLRTPKNGKAEAVEWPQEMSCTVRVALPKTDTACDAWAVAVQTTDDAGDTVLSELRLVKVADGVAEFTADRPGTYALIGLVEEQTEAVGAGFSWWLFLVLAVGVVLVGGSVTGLCLIWRRQKPTPDGDQ